MKKALYLTVFLLGSVTVLQAQQANSELPKVNLDNFTPPGKKAKEENKKAPKRIKENIPKVDLSNFKPPARTGPHKKKH